MGVGRSMLVFLPLAFGTATDNLSVNGTTIGEGRGTNKKGAREAAAKQALEYLENIHGE